MTSWGVNGSDCKTPRPTDSAYATAVVVSRKVNDPIPGENLDSQGIRGYNGGHGYPELHR